MKVQVFLASALLLGAAHAQDSVVPRLVSLPGDHGAPRVQVGKVNILSLQELPPALQDFAGDAIESRQRGFALVDEDDWEWPVAIETLQPALTSTNGGVLALTPLSLAGTELGLYRVLGSPPDDARPGEKRLTATRYFERPDGALIVLRETRFAPHGAIVLTKELINCTVNGRPATLDVAKSPSGRVRSVLFWANSSVDFTLMVLDDVDHQRQPAAYDRAWLLRVAESLRT
jgi:hypothetical protein